MFNPGIFERLLMKNHIPSRGEKQRKFGIRVIFNNELKFIIFIFLVGRLV